ncbi:copper resistance protein NlpE N-terminal domain-containing protein [uncultured Cardiobacterium sp.]|uniref:copper resistance protein NlpE N-terminal domain-containing protein n=1 Tax=uncultured Cardiobacterium sp. TaxID=417619 RepID=UPI0026198AB5|nr:copper resistance protein NlpE N-terminal domain-containing protein [uncultured Cardiobacterium sp.]
MKKLTPVGLALALIISGCTTFGLGGSDTPPPVANNPPAQQPPAANNNNAAFLGTYNGVLPCADCDGLQISLTLTGGNYTIQSTKLGKKQENKQDSGVYRTTTDKQYLQLDNNAGNLTFQIGNGYLELRRPDGEKLDPSQPDEKFRLKRQ